MRAVSLFGPRDLQLVERPEPSLAGGHQTMATVAAVGLCGSDLHYYKDGHIGATQTVSAPFTPGHEFAVWLNYDVRELGLKAGTLVAVDPGKACGQCEWCRRDEINLCPKPIFIGAPPYDGALCDQMAIDIDRIVPIPTTIDAAGAAMLEPLGICIHALDLAKPQWFETVAVVGCGPIGLGVIQLLRLAGVHDITAIEPVAYRRDKAIELGAAAGFADGDAWLQASGGRGADLVIEATNSPLGFAAACTAARIGGRAVIIGIPDGNSYTFEAATARRKQLSIIFSRRMTHTYPRAIDLVVKRGLDLTAFITHTISLEQVPDAFDMLCDHRDGAIKVMVTPNPSN